MLARTVSRLARSGLGQLQARTGLLGQLQARAGLLGQLQAQVVRDISSGQQVVAVREVTREQVSGKTRRGRWVYMV